MMMDLSKKTLANAFFWFAVVLGIFGVVTEVYGTNIYLPSEFYIQLGILGMLGSIAAAHKD